MATPDPAHAQAPQASERLTQPAPGAERTRSEQVRYRRAPRIPVFLVVGGLLGALAGAITGAVGSGVPAFTEAQVVGYMLALGALIGLALGAVTALVVDRVSILRARTASAERTDAGSTDPAPTHPTED